MSGQIFISYRREEASAWARLIHDRLSEVFKDTKIFMDVDTLEIGLDFEDAIEKSLSECHVLIAVIGKRWPRSKPPVLLFGQRISKDYVRFEVASALKRRIRVIPVLVDGAKMPRSSDLPDDLKPLIRLGALQLSHERFRTDSERLESAVKRSLEEESPERSEHEEQTRAEHEPHSSFSGSPEKKRRRSVAAKMTFLALIVGVVVLAGIYLASPWHPESGKHPSASPTAQVAPAALIPFASATPPPVETSTPASISPIATASVSLEGIATAVTQVTDPPEKATKEEWLYRLPTDAEWSIAAGLKGEQGNSPKDKDRSIKLYPWGKKWPPPKGAGNYAGEEAKTGDWPSGRRVIEHYNDGYSRTSPVDAFAPNANGLYDMGDNVRELCEDLYDSFSQGRVLRGASWCDYDANDLRVSNRSSIPPNHFSYNIGFRCVLDRKSPQ